MTILASNGFVTNNDDSIFAQYKVSKIVTISVPPKFSTDLESPILLDLAVP
jgi:hypothetical protein